MKPFCYLIPPFYFNATVQNPLSLGDLNTGSLLVLGRGNGGRLISEPDFAVQISATVTHGDDYPIIDSSGNSHLDLRGLVVPDNGSTPFQINMRGVQGADQDVNTILTSKTNSGIKVPYGSVDRVAVVEFRGGGSTYSALQNGVFIGSSTYSSGPKDGEFTFAMKIMQVFSTKTGIVIGEEFEG